MKKFDEYYKINNSIIKEDIEQVPFSRYDGNGTLGQAVATKFLESAYTKKAKNKVGEVMSDYVEDFYKYLKEEGIKLNPDDEMASFLRIRKHIKNWNFF